MRHDAAVDGDKIKANASKHKAIIYARMVEAGAEINPPFVQF